MAAQIPDDTGIWHDSDAVTWKPLSRSQPAAHPRSCCARSPENAGLAQLPTRPQQSSNNLEATSATPVESLTPTLRTPSQAATTTYAQPTTAACCASTSTAPSWRPSRTRITSSKPDASADVKIGGQSLISIRQSYSQSAHAAVYDYALTAGQVANHAAAAMSRGYDAEPTGGVSVRTIAGHRIMGFVGHHRRPKPLHRQRQDADRPIPARRDRRDRHR